MDGEDIRTLESLSAKMAASGLPIVGIRFNACGRCREGTLRSNPSPSWMNRWTCDRCGKHASR